jgi:signal transduction histidine kinase
VTASGTPDANVNGDTIADLRDRIRTLEAQVQRAEAERGEAQEAQRAAENATRTRDEILAVVAHDLRNPLGTIVMGATALEQFSITAEPNAQRIRSVAERIQRQGARMVRQLDNLTDFLEIQAGGPAIERQPHAPSTILAAASELIGPIARERNLGFEIRAQPDLPAIACDAERVVQVLFNLCNNAIKVTASGGTITIGTRRGDRGRLEMFVRDHGPGIAREDLAAMFEPTWRGTQQGYKGAGLGFAIARGIVAAHGGQIWAESAPGAGTVVYFSLTPED